MPAPGEPAQEEGSTTAAGPAVALLTLAHFITTECRSVLLIWWSGLSIVVTEGSHTMKHDYTYLNKPMLACVDKWASSIIWGPGAVDCDANAKAFEHGDWWADMCVNNTRVWEAGINGGPILPRTAGGYQVEGEAPIIETLAGGTCTVPDPNGGNPWTSSNPLYVQAFPKFQNIEMDGTEPYVDKVLWRFALCIHLWLVLVLGSRVVLWLQCPAARDFRSGAYVQFCVEFEKSTANIWTVRFSIAIFVALMVTGFVLSLLGAGRITGQLSNFLIQIFALWKMYTTP